MRWYRPVLASFRTRLGKSAVIYPAATTNSIGLGIATLGIVFFLRYRFEASASTIGLIASLHSVTYFIGCFLLRPLSRVLLPRFSLILSTGLNGIFVLLALASPNAGLVAMWYGLSGLSLALFWPPMMGWVSTGLEGQSLNAALSKFNLSWSVGIIISPYIAGYLTELNRGLPFVVSAGMYLFVCLLVLAASLFLHNVRSDNHREPKLSDFKSGEDNSTPLRYPAWIGMLSTYMVVGILGVVLPLYGREVMGIPERTVGLILLTRGITTTVGFYALGRIASWHFKTWPILGAQLCVALCIAVLASVTRPGPYFVVVPFVGFLSASTYSFSVFHGASGSQQRAKRMAIHEALLVAGMIIGSTAGGFLYQRYSMRTVYQAAFFFTGVAMLSQLALLWFARTRTNTRTFVNTTSEDND